MIKQDIDRDLKKAMLAGDKRLVSVIRTIKSVILDGEISSGKRESGLDDATIILLLQKESKKRGEAAKLYDGAQDAARAEQERFEQEFISKYLPEMLDEQAVQKIVKEVLQEFDTTDKTQMGRVIGAVKAKTGPAADGALIAKLVKEKFSN